jgi:1-acylglycerone phosphate reductase
MVGYNLPLLDTNISEAKKMFDVNVFALVAVTQAFSPLLIASKGTIINIGSVAGKSPIPWQGMYNASKAAVNLISDQLRLELAPFDVKCICVVTGGIKTNFFENAPGVKLPAGSLYTPGKDFIEEVAGGAMIEKDGMEVNAYAEGVVENALKGSPSKLQWLGNGANGIWFVGTFLWATAWDAVFPRIFKVDEVNKRISAAQKSK